MSETVEAYVHEYVAPRVLGRDPLQIDLLASDLVGYLGFRSTGAEVRGNSAFDIALWDLYGKTATSRSLNSSAASAVNPSARIIRVPERNTSKRQRASNPPIMVWLVLELIMTILMASCTGQTNLHSRCWTRA
jgi:hypothetical protein